MGWLLAGLFVLGSIGNWGILFRQCFCGKSGSLVPFLAGLAGAVACLVLPFPFLRPWCWGPLVVEPGSGWLAFATVAFLIRHLVNDGPASH